METNSLLNTLAFSEDGPVKTPILQQEHFTLMRIALGKGVQIPPHQGGHAVFFLVIQGKGIFSHGDKETELGPNEYLHIHANEARGIKALEDMVILALKS